MAVDRTTLSLLDGLRVAINRATDATDVALIEGWGRAWNEVAAEWEEALTELTDASVDGAWPSRRQVNRAKRAQAALAATKEALTTLSATMPITILQDVPRLVGESVDWHERIVASQLPATDARTATVMAGFNRVDPLQLDAIVRRTTGQVTALSLPVAPRTEAAIKSVLIKGVAIGDSPRTAAAEMLRRVNGAFEGGLSRALVIARTEMLDAHRAASMTADEANKDLLTGWDWVATLDARTCPSCLAQHGSSHAIAEPGPLDHQQGRCSRLTKTKTWAELGFTGIEEPPDLLPDARQWFADQPESVQLRIMGRARLDALNAGDITWDNLSARRSTSGWRDSFAPTPVRDLLAA